MSDSPYMMLTNTSNLFFPALGRTYAREDFSHFTHSWKVKSNDEFARTLLDTFEVGARYNELLVLGFNFQLSAEGLVLCDELEEKGQPLSKVALNYEGPNGYGYGPTSTINAFAGLAAHQYISLHQPLAVRRGVRLYAVTPPGTLTLTGLKF